MQIGNDGDAQALERARIGTHVMFGQAQTVGHEPEDGAEKQQDGRSRKDEKNALQNLIFARDSTETALAPSWPCAFSW
jgi:hypothetical protein